MLPQSISKENGYGYQSIVVAGQFAGRIGAVSIGFGLGI